jgi:hypothetical protein
LPKPGHYDLEKEEQWRNLIRAWRQSGMLKSHFCRDHGIKLNLFCNWERKLKVRDAERSADRMRAGTGKQKAHKTSKRKGQQAAQPKAANTDTEKTVLTFVEVNVKDKPPEGIVSGSAACMIEVSCPNGLLLKLPPHTSTEVLLAILGSLSK